jgi:hypothetical protein
MWRYNLRNGPNYPWRTADAQSGLNSQTNIESASVPALNVPSYLESTQQSVYEHLDERNDYTSSLSTTRNEGAVSCFELEDSDIMMSLSMTHGTDRAPFTGSTTSGPSLAHLEQDFLALKSEIKLKNATNLNANDMFNFIGKTLAGGAKDQFLGLRRQFDEELRVKNAAASALYDRNRAAYDQANIRWDALDAAARVGQVEPQAPAAHVDSEEYDRHVERFWVMMKELYPIKSPSRVKEFGTFAMLSDETIANLVQRMQTLKYALGVQEQTAVFKLIQAIRPASLDEEVQRQLYATSTESDDWTVALVGQVAVRLDRAHSQEALWSVSVQHMDAPRAMARMSAPRQPSAKYGARTTETRSCHNCGKPGHIARFCCSQPTQAKPSVVRRNAAQSGSSARSDRVCYHCNQPGHFAAQCAVKRADLQEASGADKMWCTYHEVDSHNSADCKALQSRARPAQRAAAARSAQAAAPTSHEHATPQPTLAELQELWDAHHGPMQGFSAKVVSQTAVSHLSGHYDMMPRGHTALVHSGFTAFAKKSARPCGSSANMPLGFLSQDLPSAPIWPLEGPCATPRHTTTEPVVASTLTVLVPDPKSSTKEPVAVAMPDTSMLTLSNSTMEPVVGAMLVATIPMMLPSNSTKEPVVRTMPEPSVPILSNSTMEPMCYDCAWLSLTALSTVTCNLWL